MLRVGVVMVIACALFWPAAARAQEQRGSVEGTVRDVSGAVVPGAKVEVRSAGLVNPTPTATDSQGRYWFPALPPGRYVIAATFRGLATTSSAEFVLELGQKLKLDITLHPVGVEQTLQVNGEAPLIDVRQNAAGGIIPDEIIARIPKTRDFTGLVLSIPGVDNEAQRSRGIQIDGGSGADNRFFISGMDVTEINFGTVLAANATGKGIAPEFIEQAQVKQSGYNAEYRASIGGIVNVITRSGGTVWRGSLGAHYTSDGLRGAVRPFLQLNPTDQTKAEYVKSPADRLVYQEWLADGGGPMVRDRLWFYGNYNPSVNKTVRTVKFRSNGQVASFESKPVDRAGRYTVTSRLRPGLHLKLENSHEQSTLDVFLPSVQPDGTSVNNPALFPAPTHREGFQDSYAISLDWLHSPRAFVSVSTSYLTYGVREVGTFSDKVQHGFGASNFKFPEIPADLQHVSGFLDAPSSSRGVRDIYARYNLNADVTRYATWRGRHTLKAGLQFESVTNDVLQGAQAATIGLFWDTSYFTPDGKTTRGAYGYYKVSRLYTEGTIRANNVGLFIQDAWTIHPRLTLNFGLRVETETVPSYRPENPDIHFGLGDKIAPRAGFAWDVRGDARWKLYGSWGIFHDLMKLAVGRVMFGADHWREYYYTLDTWDWPSITCGAPPVSSENCPGTLIAAIDNRGIANAADHSVVDPNLAASRSQELVFGTEHALSGSLSMSARFVHKWVDRAVESVCDRQIVCGVNNPGFGTGQYPYGRAFPAQPIAKRVYDGMEFRVRKRLSDRWSMDASYLWSRLWGNWSGIASSDEAVNCLQPNSCLAFNFLYYSFDHAGEATYGPLGTDRPHRFKVQATYDLPWGTMVGMNYLVQSGRPFSTIVNVPGGIAFFPFGRGDLGRTPAVSQLDLLVQHQIRIPVRSARLSIGVNIQNVFDQAAAINAFNRPYRDPLNLTAEQFFAGFDPVAVAKANTNIRPDARFGLATAYQAPRVIMFQTLVSF